MPISLRETLDKFRVLNEKGFGLITVLISASIMVAIGAGVYFSQTYKDNPIQVFERLEGQENTPKSSDTMTLSNPAAEYCIKVGGELQGEIRGDGGKYSLCNFEDDMACEEWALYRRQCPIGGIKTTGFDTKEQAYCALTGGKTTAEPDANCTLPGGKVCSNSDLYNGKCQ